jgi:hypothetical protein
MPRDGEAWGEYCARRVLFGVSSSSIKPVKPSGRRCSFTPCRRVRREMRGVMVVQIDEVADLLVLEGDGGYELLVGLLHWAVDGVGVVAKHACPSTLCFGEN